MKYFVKKATDRVEDFTKSIVLNLFVLQDLGLDQTCYLIRYAF